MATIPTTTAAKSKVNPEMQGHALHDSISRAGNDQVGASAPKATDSPLAPLKGGDRKSGLLSSKSSAPGTSQPAGAAGAAGGAHLGQVRKTFRLVGEGGKQVRRSSKSDQPNTGSDTKWWTQPPESAVVTEDDLVFLRQWIKSVTSDSAAGRREGPSSPAVTNFGHLKSLFKTDQESLSRFAQSAAVDSKVRTVTGAKKPLDPPLDFYCDEGLGDVYQGDRDTRGKPHGSGVVRFKNGDVFTGSFQGGQRSGPGSFHFSDPV